MRTHSKKIIALMLAAVMVFMTPLVCYAAKNITLDVSTYKSMKNKPVLDENKTLGNGAMTYRYPSAWKTVETKLDNIDGYAYRLNEIQDQTRPDAEQLYIFYFSNEKYLADQADAGKREKIEQGIIKNILPDEEFSILNTNVLAENFPTARIEKNGNAVKKLFGTLSDMKDIYDIYDTTYTDKNMKVHNAEFVFLPNGTKGMCCALYIFTDSIHRDEIIAVLHEIQTGN